MYLVYSTINRPTTFFAVYVKGFSLATVRPKAGYCVHINVVNIDFILADLSLIKYLYLSLPSDLSLSKYLYLFP